MRVVSCTTQIELLRTTTAHFPFVKSTSYMAHGDYHCYMPMPPTTNQIKASNCLLLPPAVQALLRRYVITLRQEQRWCCQLLTAASVKTTQWWCSWLRQLLKDWFRYVTDENNLLNKKITMQIGAGMTCTGYFDPFYAIAFTYWRRIDFYPAPLFIMSDAFPNN